MVALAQHITDTPTAAVTETSSANFADAHRGDTYGRRAGGESMAQRAQQVNRMQTSPWLDDNTKGNIIRWRCIEV